MAEFKPDLIDEFLAVVRKYMQLRGALSQKDLAEQTEIGVSTMSRFLNQKTNEINADLVARISAKLDIPFHEIIDFVDEDFTNKFIRLVKFYKGEQETAETRSSSDTNTSIEDEISEVLGTKGTAQRPAVASVSAGPGSPKRNIHFGTEDAGRNSTVSLKDKLGNLSPRQKAYLTDFLNLDDESKDLMVDLGNNLFRYFRQKGLEF